MGVVDMWRQIKRAVRRRMRRGDAAGRSRSADDRAARIGFLRDHGFDTAAYIQHYGDLAGMTPEAALDHFVRHGFDEGRQAPFTLSVAAIQTLRQSQWTDGWQAELARRATQAALSAMPANGTDLERLADLLAASPDHLPAIMIGDSHSAFLNQVPAMLSAGILPVPILCLGGSARGLHNASSRAQYGTHVRDRLVRLGKAAQDRPVVFKFGQVDVEFLFDLKRVHDGTTDYASTMMRRFIDESVERYAAYLTECRAVCHGRVVAMGNFPPTLGDETIRAGYVNAHIAFINREDDIEQLRAALATLDHPDLAERTAMARYWNQRLAESCERIGLLYLEEFDGLLGDDGLVHPELADPQDHHLLLHSDRAQQRIASVGARLRALVPA